MVDSAILYEDKETGFSIEKRFLEDSDPDWEYEEYSFLSKRLIADPVARNAFLSIYLKENPPILIADPSIVFDKQLFQKSGFFDRETILIFRKSDSKEMQKLNEIIKSLIGQKYLKKDPLSLIYCNDCNLFYIGEAGKPSDKKLKKDGALFCTVCRKAGYKFGDRHRVTDIYVFSPELKDLLTKWRGRIIEGIVYHQLKSDPKIESRFDIISSPRVRHSDGEKLVSREKDIVLIDKLGQIKPIIVLASLSTSQSEKSQVEHCATLGLGTIFICSNRMSELGKIREASMMVFDNIAEDSKFPASLSDYITKEIIETHTDSPRALFAVEKL